MKYFKESEFKMGSEIVFDKMDETFLALLDELRDEVGFGLRVNSSFRTEAYNKRVGGAKNSMHIFGKATDLECTSSTKRAILIYCALDLGLSVGVYKNWIHVDSRDNQLLYVG